MGRLAQGKLIETHGFTFQFAVPMRL